MVPAVLKHVTNVPPPVYNSKTFVLPSLVVPVKDNFPALILEGCMLGVADIMMV
jgi:hypothetical protein